jgi:hypothetical protein
MVDPPFVWITGTFFVWSESVMQKEQSTKGLIVDEDGVHYLSFRNDDCLALYLIVTMCCQTSSRLTNCGEHDQAKPQNESLYK